METHFHLVSLTAVIALGVGAQWLAWRLRVPAISFLLLAGFAAGSLTGFIHPDELFGDLLFPVVSLSVALILFEGGLSLDIAEWGKIGRVVRNLVTVGALVTWVTGSAFAYFLLDFDLFLSALLGAILVVTGPTVIIPLLRHIRPTPGVASTVRWEGIINDPIGAILAVLVYNSVLAGDAGGGIQATIVGIGKAVAAGGLSGLLGAALMVWVIQRRWLPDYLQSPVTLGVVLTVFTAANVVMAESGLLAVTVMGCALASQRIIAVRRIVEFKENLRVLLISTVFVLLAARLPIDDPVYTDPGALLFLAALVIVVRPASVAIATIGSFLTWKERVFVALMGPRGIVAAAVASIFTLRLVETGHPGADRLAPVVFLVIIGTVALYGFGAGPAARWLKVASPNPQGVLFLGANRFAREIAHALQNESIPVVLVDSNWQNIAAARQRGLKGHYGDALAEHELDKLELDGIGYFLALTPNDEVNSLAVLHASDIFDSAHVFRPAAKPGSGGSRTGEVPRHLRGQALFDPELTWTELQRRVENGAIVKGTPLTDTFGYQEFLDHYGETALPLFALKDSGELTILQGDDRSRKALKAGVTLFSLVREPAAADAAV